jgi:membrane-associated phospholipid phosphatase
VSASAASGWSRLCLLGTVVALALSAAAGRFGVLPWEAGLRAAVRRLASPGAVEVAHLVSDAGTWRGLVPATLALLALSGHGRRRWWLWSGLLVMAPLVGEAWQELVGRPRPQGSALGLPSGHAVASATYAVLLIYLVGRARLARPWRLVIGAAAVTAMVAVGIARIVRDSHWAADVVVGFALGSAAAAAAAWWDLTHPVPCPPRGPAATRCGGHDGEEHTGVT